VTLVLYELRGPDDRRYSLFSWRARMALKHKGLDPQYEGVLLHDKEAIAFSGGKTVPVLRDGETVVRDSWAIAEHLERRYPDRPSLFGGEIGHAVTHAFNSWVDRGVVPRLAPMIAADTHQRIDPADQPHFRSAFEGFLRCTLEEAQAGRDTGAERFRRTLDPARVSLRTRPFLSGSGPAYADYILFSVFQWARIMSPFEVLDAKDEGLRLWRERMLDLFDGYARRHRAAE
jgi:glutathione S-transferase